MPFPVFLSIYFYLLPDTVLCLCMTVNCEEILEGRVFSFSSASISVTSFLLNLVVNIFIV